MDDQSPTWNSLTFYEVDIVCGTADDLLLSSDSSVLILRARFYPSTGTASALSLRRGESVTLRLELERKRGEDRLQRCVWIKLEPCGASFAEIGDALVVENLRGWIVAKIGDALLRELTGPAQEQVQPKAKLERRAARWARVKKVFEKLGRWFGL